MKYYAMHSTIGPIVIEAKNNNQATAVLHKAVAEIGMQPGACGICNQDEVSVLRILTNHVLYGASRYLRYSESRNILKLETFDEFKLSRHFQDAVRQLNYRS